MLRGECMSSDHLADLREEIIMSEEEIYTCATCRRVTNDKGHLCHPVETTNKYVCEFCGGESTDIRHVCKPKVAHVEYVCGTCGRLAVSEGELCSPQSI